MNDYYTYAYLDPRKNGIFIYDNNRFDNEPFYIGYGKKSRLFAHLKSAQRSDNRGFNMQCIFKIKNLLNEGVLPIIIKIHDNLTFEDAKTKEIDLIFKIGRIDLNSGPLCNLTSGGQGKRNYKLSEETKNKIKNSIQNKWKTEEYREKMRIINNSIEKKNAVSKRFKGIPKSTSHVEKMRINALGKSSPLSGKTYVEIYGKEKASELLFKMRNRNLNKSFSELYGIQKSIDIREKMSISRKGMKKSESHRQKLKENLDKQRLSAKIGQRVAMINRLKIIFNQHKDDIIRYFDISGNDNRYLELSRKLNISCYKIKQIKKYMIDIINL